MNAPVALSKSNIVLPALGLSLALALGMLITSPAREMAAGLVGVLAFVMLFLRHQAVGLLSWLVVLPFAPFLYLDISLGASIPDLSFPRLCIGMLMLVLLAQAAVGKRKLTPVTSLDVVAVLVLVGLAFSVTLARSKTYAAQSYLDAYVIPLAIYWIVKNLIQTKSDREKVLVALVIVGVYASIIAMHEQFTGQVIFNVGRAEGMYSKTVKRLEGLLGSPVAFGGVLGLTFPFMLHFLLVARRSSTRMLMAFFTLVNIGGLYAAAVRTSWIASLLGLLIILLFHPTLKRRQMRATTLGLAAIGVVVVFFFGSLIVNALLDNPIIGDRIFSDGPIRARIVLYNTAWRMAREDLVRGIGYENFSGEYSRYLTSWGDIPATEGTGARAPHNSFLYVLVSAGFLGLIPYILLFALMVVQTLKAHRGSDDAMSKGMFVAFWAAMLSYFLNAMTADVIYLRFNSMYFFALLGVFAAPAILAGRVEPGALPKGRARAQSPVRRGSIRKRSDKDEVERQ